MDDPLKRAVTGVDFADSLSGQLTFNGALSTSEIDMRLIYNGNHTRR